MSTESTRKMLTADDLETGMVIAVYDLVPTPRGVDAEKWQFRRHGLFQSLRDVVLGVPLEVVAVDRPFAYCRSVPSNGRVFALDTRVVIVRRFDPAMAQAIKPDKPDEPNPLGGFALDAESGS